MKTEFPDNKWKFLNKKLAYPNDYFNSVDDYQKHVENLKEEDFFSLFKTDYPSDDEIKRTKKIEFVEYQKQRSNNWNIFKK